jgi:VanZ like family
MSTVPKTNSESDSKLQWSIRILVLALGGILLLTLYPFGFSPHGQMPGSFSPFLLGGSGKPANGPDVFLNILLFVPFGFGLAGLFAKRGKSLVSTAAIILITGAFLSYTIEFLQFFIPERDSGWLDVLTNSTGALVGCLVFELFGRFVIGLLKYCEDALESFADWETTAIVLLLFFAVWLTISARLQQDTSLQNWVSDAQLVVGNSVLGKTYSIWSGKIFSLDLWNRPIQSEDAKRLTAQSESAGSSALAEYDFSASPPFADLRHTLPELEEAPIHRSSAPPGNMWNGKAWLVSSGPVSSLVADLQTTDQFALRLTLAPNQVSAANGYIFSVSRRDGTPDMELRQDNTGVAFSFRTPISARRALGWHIPNILAAGQTTDILFSYDGSNLSAFVNGERWKGTYRLSPATRLASLIHHVKAPELDAYRYSFYAVVFFPAGCFIGLTGRRIGSLALFGLFIAGIVLPSILLELILVHVGGQAITLQDIVLSCAMGLAGLIWINLGYRYGQSPKLQT